MTKVYGPSFWGDENVKLVVVIAQVYEQTETIKLDTPNV